MNLRKIRLQSQPCLLRNMRIGASEEPVLRAGTHLQQRASGRQIDEGACSPPIRMLRDPRQLVVSESLLGAAVPAAQRIGAEQINAPLELVRGGKVLTRRRLAEHRDRGRLIACRG